MQGQTRTGWLIGLVIAIAIAGAIFAVLSSDKAGSSGSGLRSDFSYDVSQYAKTDPQQILYAQCASFTSGVKNPHALAVGRGDEIVVGGDKVVAVFDSQGKPLRQFSVSAQVTAVAVDAAGTLYAATHSPTGAHIEVIGSGNDRPARQLWTGSPKSHYTSLAVDEASLFVADYGQRVVLRLSVAGAEIGRIGQRDESRKARGFVLPSPYFDIAIAANGTLCVADTGRHRIEAFKLDGEYLSHWGQPGMAPERFSGCCNPAHFALAPDGSFVTAEKGLCRVKLYAADGKFLGFVAGAESFEKARQAYAQARLPEADAPVVHDLSVDSRGRVLVIEPSSGDVLVFERSASAQPNGARAKDLVD